MNRDTETMSEHARPSSLDHHMDTVSAAFSTEAFAREMSSWRRSTRSLCPVSASTYKHRTVR